MRRSVPSSMPNGATVSAFSGAGMPGTAGIARLDPDVVGARNAAADANALALPRHAVVRCAAGDGVHQVLA